MSASRFRLRFFGSFSRQREELLNAKTFEPIPLHPSVQSRVDAIVSDAHKAPPHIEKPLQLFLYVFLSVGRLVCESIAWNILSTFIVLSSILVTREIFRGTSTIIYGIGVAVIFLLLKVGQAAIDYLNHLRRLQVHRGVQVSLYQLVTAKLVHLDPMNREEHSRGQLKTLVGSDIEIIEDLVSASLNQWIPALVSIIVLTPAVYFVSGAIGLFAVGVTFLIIPIALLGARVIEYVRRHTQAQQDSTTTLIGEWVKNIRLVRYLGWDEAIEREVVERMRKYNLFAALHHAVSVCMYALAESWAMVPLLAMFWFMERGKDTTNLLQIFSTFWILDHLLAQIRYIPRSLSYFGSAMAGARRVISLLSLPDLDRFIRPSIYPQEKNRGAPIKMTLENVSLRYGDTDVLDDISLSFSLNERTAIVGSVASGKSTLIEVLIGERHPTKGDVIVEFEDGTKESLWTDRVYTELRSMIAYSPQQPFISNTSLRLNLDLSGYAAVEDLESATITSRLKPDLLLLPNLYEEEIGEAGINLSGGQKQRVSLARAFLSGRKIFIFDDPLSAMDPKTEAELMDSILAEARGLILVSHRLTELKRCDRIIVMKLGKIIEDGTPQDLIDDPHSNFLAFLQALEEHG